MGRGEGWVDGANAVRRAPEEPPAIRGLEDATMISSIVAEILAGGEGRL